MQNCNIKNLLGQYTFSKWFLANPLENHVEFWKTPSPPVIAFFRFVLANFYVILNHFMLLDIFLQKIKL